MTSRPRVSIVVPSIGATGMAHGEKRTFVTEAVRSVAVGATGDLPLEIVLVAGRDMPPSVPEEVLAAASSGTTPVAVQVVDDRRPFNFSAAVNLGAAHARGEHLLFLNDDTEVLSSCWLHAMLDALGDDHDGRRVGAVGARLLFEDGTLQHAGHTYRTSLDHLGVGLPADSPGRNGVLVNRREVAGVTAACLLTPFAVFDAVGGFCTGLPGNYNDVDYCMKLRSGGWSVIYEPEAVLYHYESRSRDADIHPHEVEFIQRRWATHLADDPYTP